MPEPQSEAARTVHGIDRRTQEHLCGESSGLGTDSREPAMEITCPLCLFVIEQVYFGVLDGDGSMDWLESREEAERDAARYSLPLFRVTISYEPLVSSSGLGEHGGVPQPSEQTLPLPEDDAPTIVFPTAESVEVMLAQLARDRRTAYWGQHPHVGALEGAEAWLLSLRDHLSSSPGDLERPVELPTDPPADLDVRGSATDVRYVVPVWVEVPATDATAAFARADALLDEHLTPVLPVGVEWSADPLEVVECAERPAPESHADPASPGCPCGHPPGDHREDGCVHLCDCAWPSATVADPKEASDG